MKFMTIYIMPIDHTIKMIKIKTQIDREFSCSIDKYCNSIKIHKSFH